MINQKAEVTIEALFIMGVFILILVTVSISNIFEAVDTTRDVRVVSDAKYVAEQIATYASSITNPYEKKILRIYIPGYSSSGTTPAGDPLIWIRSCISTDGDVLNTTVQTIRYSNEGIITKQEEYSFTKDLPGTGWAIYVPNSTAPKPIFEDEGYTYTLVISWKNITSQTELEWIVDNCTSQGFAARVPGGR